MQIPSQEGNLSQPNNGTKKGSLFATFGVDFDKNRGAIGVSSPVVKTINTTDNANFDSYVAKFLEYQGKYYAIASDIFSASTPDGTWSEETSFNSTSNAIADGVIFNNLLLYSQGDDIRYFDGTSDGNFWTGASYANQSALTPGSRHFLKVGPDGNLYVFDTDSNNRTTKVYRVDISGGTYDVSLTAEGTLDFSSTDYEITCVETNSTRMFIGLTNREGGYGAIAEWDMGPSTISANKIHPIEAKGVRTIPIWNDTPIAILTNGNVKVWNGGSFVEYVGMEFPLESRDSTSEWIHPNGWAIIDKMPHLFIGPGKLTDGNNYQDRTASPWNASAGIWCLDPLIGLYNRFPVGAGIGTDYGMLTVGGTGALYTAQTETTSFLAGFEYFKTATLAGAALVYGDLTNSVASRGFFSTTDMLLRDVPSKFEAYHKKLVSGEEIRAYYRQSNEDNVILDGFWADNKHFHTTESVDDIEVGNIFVIKTGEGAGSIQRIIDISSSASVNIITIEEAESLITSADHNNTIEVMNFKKLAYITNQTIDWHSYTMPVTSKSRKVQVLVELRQAASNNMELDNVIIE